MEVREFPRNGVIRQGRVRFRLQRGCRFSLSCHSPPFVSSGLPSRSVRDLRSEGLGGDFGPALRTGPASSTELDDGFHLFLFRLASLALSS